MLQQRVEHVMTPRITDTQAAIAEPKAYSGADPVIVNREAVRL